MFTLWPYPLIKKIFMTVHINDIINALKGDDSELDNSFSID